MASRQLSPSRERIPFWRNVKTIGIMAQVIFGVLVAIAIYWLYSNVTTALSRSNLPADFSFLRNRAGIPIAESPISYTPDDPYWRALLIGILNTLKVSLIGVVLASLLGVLIGVMRLSQNWMLRQLATAYVELIRNTPIAVQIIFWYTAALATIPPNITNPVVLPFGIYLSNRGVAFPFFYPSYSFGAWLPWLVVGVVVALVVWGLRRRQIAASERPGSTWTIALAALVLIAGVGYFVVGSSSALPENIGTDFRADRGRGTVFVDENDNAQWDRGERSVPYASAVVTIEEARLSDTTQNLIESRRVLPSTFRFPFIRPSEVESYEVGFADEADAARFSLDFIDAPSVGVIYEDRNDNGLLDRGEDVDSETGQGFSGVRLNLTLENFTRRVVADRDAQVRLPRFEPVGNEAQAGSSEESSSGGVSAGPRSLFGTPSSGEGENVGGGGLNASFELQRAGPLVYSPPSIPVSNYEGGFSFTPSYLAILLALVIYTASFIAEIVRAGVLAIPKGQTEAAKAVGLSNFQTFNLVVFPQSIRIILPPMISQYLNLTKNSSLGPLAAYGELFAISTIVANQTGASVPVTILIILAYLLISLTFALILNIVNNRMTIVER